MSKIREEMSSKERLALAIIKAGDLRDLVFDLDIPSPTVPEYVELHEGMQKILKYIDSQLLPELNETHKSMEE